MLLTSSQVSVAVSSSIVILCTSALFLSGYVIQQRTLRELRTSIRSPKPEPKIFLPDRFKKMTTELADGTVVEIEDNEDDNTNPGVGPEKAKQQTIVVTPSRPGAEDQRQPSPQQQQQQQQQQKQQPQQQQQQQNLPKKDQPQVGKNPGRGKAAPRPSPGTGDRAEPAPAPADRSADEPQKPVSRAERRRRIKEELKRLAYDDKPVYYQRRLY